MRQLDKICRVRQRSRRVRSRLLSRTNVIMIGLCLRSAAFPHIIFRHRWFVTGFRMSVPARLYTTGSGNNPAVTLYNTLAEDLAAETDEHTPRPRRSKRTKPENDDGAFPTTSSVGNTESGRSSKRVKVEQVLNDDAERGATSPKRGTKSPRPKAPKKQKPIQQSLDKPHPAPEHWKEQYDTIKSMRARLKAPVDTMGCDQAQNGETDPKVRICYRASPRNNFTLKPHRIVDSPLWSRSCFHPKQRMKLQMQPYRNCGPP